MPAFILFLSYLPLWPNDRKLPEEGFDIDVHQRGSISQKVVKHVGKHLRRSAKDLVEIPPNRVLSQILDHLNVLGKDLLLLSELILSQCVEQHYEVVVVEFLVYVHLQQCQLLVILLDLDNFCEGCLSLLAETRKNPSTS